MANFRHPWAVNAHALSLMPGANAFARSPVWNTPSAQWDPPFSMPVMNVAGASTTLPAGGGAAAAQPTLEASGSQWVARFPTSTSLADLTPTFGTAVASFIAAIKAAGGSVTISATYRPPERAYLMHYAWAIGKDGLSPVGIEKKAGVDIDWAHLDVSGKSDHAAAVQAAKDMVKGYAMAHIAVLVSRHTQKRAVDMTIHGIIGKSIKDASGTATTINALKDLNPVGKSYGVIKLVSDAPHWSDDGH